MWSLEYVQVPSEEEKVEEIVVDKDTKKLVKAESQSESTKKRVHELVKQMSLNNESTGELQYIKLIFCCNWKKLQILSNLNSFRSFVRLKLEMFKIILTLEQILKSLKFRKIPILIDFKRKIF